MKIKKTVRGFSCYEFEDCNGIKCSLQESSSEDAIWLGCEDANPQRLIPGEGWHVIEMPSEYIANTRMHLTQDQVKNLLPVLQKFVEKGEI